MKKIFYFFLLLSSIIGLQAQNSETDYNVHQIPYHPYDIPAPLPLVSMDDDFSSVLNIGFPFTFFGNTYEQLLIGDNGVISFNIDLAGQYCNWQFDNSIPDPSMDLLNAIFGVYQDTYPYYGGNISCGGTGTPPFRKFIAVYDGVSLFQCNDIFMTSQMILYEGYHMIDIQVGERTPCNNWNNGNGVIGIINSTGEIAYTPPGRNTGNWSAIKEGWRFVHNEFFPDYQYILPDYGDDGTENFDLSQVIDYYTGQSYTSVSLYKTLEDAENNANSLTGTYTNIMNPQTLFVKFYDGNDFVIRRVLLAVIDTNADYDEDGIPSIDEDLNANGNYGDDDTDHNGIPDFLDDDDDGDMVLTQIETNYTDTDNDGIPNYLDDDDDGDGTLTADEDYNGNANPADDDTNDNGIPDYLDEQIMGNGSLPEDAVFVYPVPVKNILHIDLKTNMCPADIQLFAPNGKLMRESKLDKTHNEITLPAANGVYFLKITTKQGEIYKPIIKE